MRDGYDEGMGIPISIILIAGGAILAFAVDATSSAVDINTVGWILMVAGLVGLVLSMILWDSWAGGGAYGRRRAAAAPRRRTVVEDVDEPL
jgi:Domain of unknown function (DUF6458)